MSNVTSPQRFSGAFDLYYDSNYDPDISAKMKVPKIIRVSGENDNEPTVNWARFNGSTEKISMEVPDRIVVAGGNEIFGSRGIPREVQLEKEMHPNADPLRYRVQTPPRSITLDSYNYPDIDMNAPSEQDKESISTLTLSNPATLTRNDTFSSPMQEPGTPGMATDLSPSEEVQLLRRQMGKLNRRVMTLEMDSQQRANREMFLYSLGVAYFLIKAILWLNRN